MKTLKLLIVANKCKNWSTWSEKIAQMQAWFSAKVNLDITLQHTSFENVPFTQYISNDPAQNALGQLDGINPKWYDDHVSPMGIGYDIILFVSPMTQWPWSNRARGWRYDNTFGAIELQIGADEQEDILWGGQNVGSTFFNYGRHEIMHALFMITRQEDTTHKWWNISPDSLINALNEIIFPTPNNAERIALITSIINRLLDQIKKAIMEPTKNKIDIWAKAIQDFEGYYAPGENSKYPNGTLAWKNNNPGNFKYVSQYTATGKDKNGFAIFPSYQVGFDHLKKILTNAATGKSSVYKPEMSLLQFFQTYAPAGDNNYPTTYARFVADRLGVDIGIQIKNLA